VISGSNGSGKSTFLKIVSGLLAPSEGTICFKYHENEITKDSIFQYISIATPYLDLYEQLTLEEILNFHFKFKSPIEVHSNREIADLLYLQKSINQPVRTFSSGMKQRLKLGLAILSSTPILLLDEPTSNLDRKAIQWYKEMIDKFGGNRLIIVCSNQQEDEYQFCDQEINIEDFK
jgi:ABC-type multidrug transport system ATPase subunit